MTTNRQYHKTYGPIYLWHRYITIVDVKKCEAKALVREYNYK